MYKLAVCAQSHRPFALEEEDLSQLDKNWSHPIGLNRKPMEFKTMGHQIET